MCLNLFENIHVKLFVSFRRFVDVDTSGDVVKDNENNVGKPYEAPWRWQKGASVVSSFSQYEILPWYRAP